jgi:hypothetical protein
MNLNIDSASLSVALLASISAEARDEMLKEALKTLVAPQRSASRYGGETEPSQMQEIYARELINVLKIIIKEQVASDPEIKKMLEVELKTFVRGYFQGKDKIRLAIIEGLMLETD